MPIENDGLTTKNKLQVDFREISLTGSKFYHSQGVPDYNPDELVGRKGLEIYKKMRDDDQIKAVLTMKKFARLMTPWEISPASQDPMDVEIAEFIKVNFETLEGTFEDNLLNIFTALDYGFSLSEKIWYRIEKGKFAGKIGLRAIKTREPFYYQFESDNFGNLVKNGIVYTGPGDSVFETKSENVISNSITYGRRLPVDKFIIYSYNREFSNWYGRSDLKGAYRSYWSKELLIRFMNIYMERFGMPTHVAKVPKNMSKPDKELLRTVLDRVQSKYSIVVPEDVAIELLTAGTGGEGSFRDSIEMHNKFISRSILVPDLMGFNTMTGGGSYALGKKHFDVFLWILQKLGRDIEETVIGEQVIKQLVDYNYSNVENYPKFKFESITAEGTATRANIVQMGVTGGFINPEEEWIREYLALPKRDEKYALGLPAQAPPGLPPKQIEEPELKDAEDKLIDDLKTENGLTDEDLEEQAEKFTLHPRYYRVIELWKKKKYASEEQVIGPDGKKGVWRTVRGRPIFIPEGEASDLSDNLRMSLGERKAIFKGQNIKPFIDRYEKELIGIPDNHIKSAKIFMVDSIPTKGGRELPAKYNPDEDIIYLNKNNAKNIVARSLIPHEIGHRVWFKNVSHEQRSQYREAINEEKAVSEYGKTNVDEDFSEAYWKFIKNKESFVEKFPKRAVILNNLFKEFKEDKFVAFKKEIIIDISKIHPNPEQWKLVDMYKVRSMLAVLDRNEDLSPIKVDKDYNVIDGHHRLKAYLLAHKSEVPIEVVNYNRFDYEESQHPRDDSGRWTSGGGNLENDVKPSERIFDVESTGVSHYDNLFGRRGLEKDNVKGISQKEYYEKHKGQVGKIVNMSPDTYLNAIPFAKPSPESQKFLKNQIKDGKKLKIGFLDFSDNKLQQEGRNRAYLAKSMGIKRIPILIVAKDKLKLEQLTSKYEEFAKKFQKEDKLPLDNRFDYKIDFVQMKEDLDEFESETVDALSTIIKLQKESLLKSIEKKGIIENKDYTAVDNLQLKFVGDFKKEIEQRLIKLYLDSKLEMIRELVKGSDGQVQVVTKFADVTIQNWIPVSPSEAIDFFNRKVLAKIITKEGIKKLITMALRKELEYYDSKAFAIAGVEKENILKKAKFILLDGLKAGASTKDVMFALGNMFDDYLVTGELVDEELSTPARLETIVRTNFSEALNAGRKAMFDNPDLEDFVPYLQWKAILDDRVRPTHAEMHNKIFKRNDPAIDNLPPAGHNCR